MRLFFVFVFASLQLFSFAEQNSHKKVLLLMGSRFEITAISENEAKAWQGINAAIDEITRIEKLISSWDSNSQTSQINQNAGIKPIKVDKELFDLIKRAKKISTLTDGAFDISYASMDKIWKFDGSVTTLPSENDIKASVAKINFNDIILDENENTVFLRNRGMKIGFGAIGKGYAANSGKKIMKDLGIVSGIVNAGGDLITWGKEANGSDWSIGVSDPKNKLKVLGWLTVGEMAVVTSGNYEKFIMIDGERYSHIIDPRSGYPVHGLKSVTIICPDAELADALATSVFILGKEKGIHLIDQLKGVEVMVVDDNDEISTSSNLKLNYYQNNLLEETVNHNLVLGNEKN